MNWAWITPDIRYGKIITTDDAITVNPSRSLNHSNNVFLYLIFFHWPWETYETTINVSTTVVTRNNENPHITRATWKRLLITTKFVLNPDMSYNFASMLWNCVLNSFRLCVFTINKKYVTAHKHIPSVQWIISPENWLQIESLSYCIQLVIPM